VKTITDKSVLKAMAKAKFIQYPAIVAGQNHSAFNYVKPLCKNEGGKAGVFGMSPFEYEEKTYKVQYFDGCFLPFVVYDF